MIVGDGACGKTSLLSVFSLGEFPSEYEPTIFEVSPFLISLSLLVPLSLSIEHSHSPEDLGGLPGRGQGNQEDGGKDERDGDSASLGNRQKRSIC